MNQRNLPFLSLSLGVEILRLKSFLALRGLDLPRSDGILPPVLLLKTFWLGERFLRSTVGLPIGVVGWSGVTVSTGVTPLTTEGTQDVEADAILCATVNLVASD